MYDDRLILSTKHAFIVNRALCAMTSGHVEGSNPEDATEALHQTADLVLEMRRGIALVTGSSEQLGYTAESIPAATRALSIIQSLSLASRIHEADEMLASLETDLRGFVRGAVPDIGDLTNLHNFLSALHQNLTDEVVQGTLGTTLIG